MKLKVILKKDNIKIKKTENKKKRKSIEELFANYKGKYRNKEIYWGEPKGAEVF